MSWKSFWKLIISWFKKKPEEEEKPANDTLSKIAWLGADYSKAKETAKIKSAEIRGQMLYTNYEYSGWPDKAVGMIFQEPNAPDVAAEIPLAKIMSTDVLRGVTCDAIACFFYEKGEGIVGGKFDWWRKGGQSAKTLENVVHGYNGHVMPEKGTKCWTMIVSVDGRQRSNLQQAVWK